MSGLGLWLVAIIAWGGTAGMRYYAVRRNLIDTPNARSSHRIPTPRGGGAAIVLAALVGWLGAYATGHLSAASALGYIGAGLGVAVLGFLDDHGHVKARWRLIGHFAAAAWLVYWIGPITSLPWGNHALALGIWGVPLTLVGVVWLLNLYNFMDGIDGIAGGQAVTVCALAALMYALLGDLALLAGPLCLALACAGFLLWNWPPARIFMGDVGSGFVGVSIAGLMLQAVQVRPQYLWCWLVLMAVFVGDATWTLVRRALRGVKVYEAHRSHTYQKAARRYQAHRPVLLAVLAYNLVALGGLAFAGLYAPAAAPWLALLGYLPVLWLAWRFQAGTD